MYSKTLSIIFSVTFAAVSVLLGASRAYTEQPPLLTKYSSIISIGKGPVGFGDGVPKRICDRLLVNTAVSCRTVVRQGEGAGIKDLRELTETVGLEEHWVFLPDKDLWIEIGFREKLGSVEIDHDYLEKIIRGNDKLGVYHLHPKNYLAMMEKKGYANIPETWLALPSL
ncbi:MAG: hypothetical protein GY852_02600, partial [bacterium]|nr:hypothetical protein [bacterium]